MNDFKDKVVYQIYPKSFMDSNGDCLLYTSDAADEGLVGSVRCV